MERKAGQVEQYFTSSTRDYVAKCARKIRLDHSSALWEEWWWIIWTKGIYTRHCFVTVPTSRIACIWWHWMQEKIGQNNLIRWRSWLLLKVMLIRMGWVWNLGGETLQQGFQDEVSIVVFGLESTVLQKALQLEVAESLKLVRHMLHLIKKQHRDSTLTRLRLTYRLCWGIRGTNLSFGLWGASKSLNLLQYVHSLHSTYSVLVCPCLIKILFLSLYSLKKIYSPSRQDGNLTTVLNHFHCLEYDCDADVLVYEDCYHAQALCGILRSAVLGQDLCKANFNLPSPNATLWNKRRVLSDYISNNLHSKRIKLSRDQGSTSRKLRRRDSLQRANFAHASTMTTRAHKYANTWATT